MPALFSGAGFPLAPATVPYAYTSLALGVPTPSQGPPPPVDFTAFLETNMDDLLLQILPVGFIRTLTPDTILVDFGAGDVVRLFGEFDYSTPVDVPVGGTLERLQELDGNTLRFEAKYLNMPIVEVLHLAGHDNATLFAGLFSGDDKFTGSNFNDLLRGAGGNDKINGGGGYDQLFGDDGNDTVDGGPGGSYLRGGQGEDVLYGGADFDDMHGNAGNDTLYGRDGGDWVVGGQGDDSLFGESGDDLLLGNLGWDTLTGGTGNDTMRGGQDNDVLVGGDGNDWLSGDRGFDSLYGGPGADTFFFFPGADVDRIQDFNAVEGDRVQLQLGTIYTVEQVGPDVLLRSGQFDQLVIVGVQLTSLPSGWLFGA